MKHSTVNLCLGILLFIGAVVSIIKQEPAIERWGAMIMAVVLLVGAQILHAIEKREKTNE